MDTLRLLSAFYFFLWPVYFALVAIVILRNKIKNRFHFFIFSILSCYGLEQIIKNIGRLILKKAYMDYLMIQSIFTWFLAVLLIYWLFKVYERKTT